MTEMTNPVLEAAALTMTRAPSVNYTESTGVFEMSEDASMEGALFSSEDISRIMNCVHPSTEELDVDAVQKIVQDCVAESQSALIEELRLLRSEISELRARDKMH